jgi:hypothetical protein
MEFPAFYGTRKFITAFTSARHQIPPAEPTCFGSFQHVAGQSNMSRLSPTHAVQHSLLVRSQNCEKQLSALSRLSVRGQQLKFQQKDLHEILYWNSVNVLLTAHRNTGCLQNNGAVSNINKKFISHLTRAKRTPLVAATVQVFYALIITLQYVHPGSHDTHPHDNRIRPIQYVYVVVCICSTSDPALLENTIE